MLQILPFLEVKTDCDVHQSFDDFDSGWPEAKGRWTNDAILEEDYDRVHQKAINGWKIDSPKIDVCVCWDIICCSMDPVLQIALVIHRSTIDHKASRQTFLCEI
jgi:hypothetical protein